MFVINDIIRRAALVNGAGPAILTDDGVVTWGEMRVLVERLAGGLRRRGLKRGDRVAILAVNSPRYYEIMFAVIWAGGVLVPINTRFSDKEILYCLNDLEGAWVGADDALLQVVERLKGQVQGLQGLLHIGLEVPPAGYTGMAELASGDPALVGADPLAKDVAMIYYTGGTTGLSKGVMLSHLQVKHTAQQIAAAMKTEDPICSDSVFVHAAPMYHMADGAMCFTMAMVAGANSFMTRYDIPAFVQHVNRHKVTHATLVPTMIKTLCDYLNTHRLALPTLKGVLYGGAPMPPPVLELAMQTLPGVQLFQGYGSTEALIISVLEPQYHVLDVAHRDVLRSAGRPLAGVLIAILDAEGRELPPGQVGEVCVRSNAVMKGYWKKPELTLKTLHGNWLHTGDAGYLDERGFLYLVDRVKDMVISGGENIYPKEVENALLTCREIDECAVIGLPHDTWGEVVHAIVRPKPGAQLDEHSLTQLCRTLIAGYKLPKSFEFVDEELPRTSLGKIDKVAMRNARRGELRR
ncbi:MAG: AMP-binding protein [Steroidobacteraceae bacterium]